MFILLAGWLTDWGAVAEPLGKFDEQGAISAGLDPDDHFADEGGIESADIILFMTQLTETYLTAG